MTPLLDTEFCDKLCEWIEEYVDVHLESGTKSHLPRNIPYIKKAFKVMIDSGHFKDSTDIQKACLREAQLIIPCFLFEK